MKHLQEFYYLGIHFMFVENCGLQEILADGSAADCEDFQTKKIRKEAEALIEAGDLSEFDII